MLYIAHIWASLVSQTVKKLQYRGPGFDPWVGNIPWMRKWLPTPVLLPGDSHGQRSLVGCSPWGHKESDTTERLHFHFSVSCIGEGNGNPLQCSCLENPRDGRAWWAAVSGVTQSQTQLKRFSSSSSSSGKEPPCQCRKCKRCRLNPWVWKIPWKRKWQSTPVFLSGKSHGQRSLVGYSLWVRKRVGHDLATTATIVIFS